MNSGQVAIGSVLVVKHRQICTGKELMHPFSIYNVYGHIQLTLNVTDLGIMINCSIVCCCLDYPSTVANYWLVEMSDSVEGGSNMYCHRDSLFNLKTEACYNLT